MSCRSAPPAGAAWRAAAVATAAGAWLRARPPAGAQRWQRTNYRGRRPLLVAGPAVAVGALAGVLTAPTAPREGARHLEAPPVRTGGALVAGLAAAGLGLYDDLAGDSHARGLSGHVQALREGRITTGLVKFAGLAGAAVAASAVERRPMRRLPLDVVLVAGAANLVNLLDLRPGRALKATLAAGLPLAVIASEGSGAARVAGAVVGAAAVTLPGDLAEQVMIGDCGANALGALIGWAAARRLSGSGRLVVAAAVCSLTVASERHSFTAVIDRTPWLAAVDRWGRRP